MESTSVYRCKICHDIVENDHVHISEPLNVLKEDKVDRRFDKEYPVGSAGFEILHCRTIEYRKMWLDIFKAEILSSCSPSDSKYKK